MSGAEVDQAQVSPAVAKTPRQPRSVWLWLRLCLLSTLLLLASTLALVGSNAGLQLLWLLQPQLLPALQIQQLQGDIWQGITLRDLSYQQPGLDVKVSELQIRLELACLWRQQLCLPLLQLQGLNVVQQANSTAATDVVPAEATATAETAETAAQQQTIALLPFDLQINQLILQDIRLQLPGQRVRIASLHTGVALNADLLSLQQPTLKQSLIELSAATSAGSSENPLPDLLKLQLPFQLVLNTLQVTDLDVRQGKQQLLALQSLSTNLSLQTDQWQMRDTRVQLQQPALTLQGEMALQPQSQNLLLQLQLSARSADLPQPIELKLNGSGLLSAWQLQAESLSLWPLQLKLQANLVSPDIAFQATLQGDELRWPLTAPSATSPQQLLLQKIQAEFNGDLQQQQLSLQVTSQHSQLPQADWQLKARQQANKITVQQLALQSLNGTAEVSGELNLKTLDLNAELELDGMQPGLYWADYPGELNGEMQLSGNFSADTKRHWQVLAKGLNFYGELRNQPLTLAGELALEQPVTGLLQLKTPGLTLKHGPNQLQMNGALAEQLTLDAQLHIADLSYSLALAEGQIDGSVQLRGDVQQPDVQLNLNAHNVNYLDDYALTELTASASLPALGSKSSQISLNLKNGQAPGWQLQQLDWQSEGTVSAHQTHLTLDSHQLKAVLAMQAGMNKQRWQTDVQELRLQSDMGDWQLQQPWQVVLDVGKQQAELGAACLQQAAASICLSKTRVLSARQGALAIALQQLPLSSLDPLLPGKFSMDGDGSGQLVLNWQQGRLAALNWDLNSNQGLLRHQLTTVLELPWHDLSLKGGLQNYQLSTQLQATLASDSAIAANVEISQLNTKAPQLKANLQLAPLSLAFLQPVFNEFSKFDGLLSTNLRAEGALTNPAIYGNLAVDALQLTGQQAPLELTKASLLASFRGFAASLNSDWQTPEGRLNVTGDANWLTPDAWFSQLEVKGDKLQLQLMDADLTVSPQLKMTASPHSGQITGVIDVPAGSIRFNSLPEDAVRVSDDEVILSKTSSTSAKSTWALSSDIRLKIGEQVRLSAFGLKTRLQGDLRVRQQGLVPTLHGQVQLKDGSFRAYGQDLKLRKGRLTFNGPATQPLLAIEAIRNPEKTEDNVIAGLRVNGLADSPLIEVFSEPSKPQANALAYLLMGRDIGSSAGDGAVTTGLIGIGIANSGQLVGAIGEAFGISDLSLDTAGSGDKSKVTVSGYLSPRLQVKYGVGIFSQFGEFTLRYRLMQQVYLEAVQGIATSVDLLYKMEFD
ncbi:translocation/assembly module TamB domain-containing protein [Rheinheimera texasensis]|uniref:autotransporter assembly complex protein TamB n=1 Tax=Rheinheimera texasensis TaxID=306205 RepID=UPI0004E137D9|nr:translocation/assembly module TamB domain-containing protein [Rheinheimera texasensis]